MSGSEAKEYLAAGADAFSLHTAIFTKGPFAAQEVEAGLVSEDGS